MVLKQQKFQSIKNTLTVLNANKSSICVFVHVSNLNTIQSNLLKLYCKKNNVKIVSVKLNLLQKLTKNSLFSNLCSGPTKLFFFENYSFFLEFTKNIPLNDKLIPLAVFYNNNFYSYSFFANYIKNTFNDINSDKIALQTKLIFNLNNQSRNLIYSTQLNFLRFMRLLTVLKEKKI